jgi:hypothetical protein
MELIKTGSDMEPVFFLAKLCGVLFAKTMFSTEELRCS